MPKDPVDEFDAGKTRVDALSSLREYVENSPSQELVGPRVLKEQQGMCVICASKIPHGLLCGSCRDKLGVPDRFCPEQIWSAPLERSVKSLEQFKQESHILLLDAFGRPHHLSTVRKRATTAYQIGRDRTCALSIADQCISRVHAVIEYREYSGSWFLKDLGSRNGTWVNRVSVRRQPEPLDSGSVLELGSIGLYFRELEPEELGWAAAQLERTRRRGLALNNVFETRMNDAESQLLSVATEGDGGIAAAWTAKHGRIEVKLSELEAQFLRLLIERQKAQRNVDSSLRGFVQSTEILASRLPFDTPRPTRDHLKALVRRIRRRFVNYGVYDVIESQQGLGYRVQPEG